MNNITKRLLNAVAPFIGRFHRWMPLVKIEKYTAFLQGKGSGSGWDAGETRALARVINNYNSDSIIFDVGANNGEWAVKLSDQIKGEAVFYLFECSPYVLPHLSKRTPYIKNPIVVESAVSSEDGTVPLHTPAIGSGLASVHARRDAGIVQHEYITLDVPATTIDSIVAKYEIEYISLLKMDIEGHELSALKGASESLSRGIIQSISYEFGSANINSETYFHDFWDLLTGADYSIFRIGLGGILIQVKKYTEDLEYFRGATNYIAMKN